MSIEKMNEREKRRPDFVGGQAVVMADGQEWFLAKPLVRFCYDSGPAGYTAVLRVQGVDDYSSRMKALDDAGTANSEESTAAESEGRAPVFQFGPVLTAQFAVGAALLLRNYDLTSDEIASILQFGYGDDDPDGDRIRNEVLAVANGLAPKPSGDTSD